MKKYYEMKLTDFKHGWDEELQEAIAEFPEGEKLTYNYGKGDVIYYYNPIKYYNLLFNEYDKASAEINGIIDKGIAVKDLPRLIELDFRLHKIVNEYVFDDCDYSCLSERDDFTFFNRLEFEYEDEYHDYFRNEYGSALFVEFEDEGTTA